MENKTSTLLLVPKKPSITFRPKITPHEVLAKIAEDKLKEVPHAGEKEVPPKAPKRYKKPKEPGDETSPENQPEETKKPEKKPKELAFPTEGFVNKYGFIKVRGAVLEKLGWKIPGPRLALTLDVQNGELILKKKSA